MMFTKKLSRVGIAHLFISVLVVFGLLLTACAQASMPASVTRAAATPNSEESQKAKVRLALLPILDALPIHVAQKEGLFAKYNLDVEIIAVASGAERDQVIIAGQADGMINESVSTALYNKDQVQVQTVRYALAARADQAQFSILASAKSGIQSVQELKGVEIGISQGTVIDYLTDRLLQAEGFAAAEIKTVAVPKIPDRLALLGSGELKAATLPEPATSLAVQQGAVVVLDDTIRPEVSYSIITFRKPFIDQNAEGLRNFLKAIEEAVAMINADPNKYRSLLVELKLLPPPLAETFKVPTFPTAGVPDEAQWQDMIDWAKAKGILAGDVAYLSSVNSSFLP